MKHYLIILSLLLSYINGQGQEPVSLNLEKAYQLASQNYPLARKEQLIQKSKVYSIENISKGQLPQFLIYGQTSYQSDVTEIPVKLPNTDIPVLSADQYKIYAEINQELFDGGVKKIEKKAIEASAAADHQELNVELYKLKERINELYFGILLINEQMTQTNILKDDINLGLTKTKAAIANGTALKSSADNLEAELLKADQRSIELRSANNAYKDMLSKFINREIDENTILEKPVMMKTPGSINRPEILLFEKEKRSFDVQHDLIRAKNKPRIGLFLQGGYGRPALNMLKNEFDPYYVGGIRFNWSLSGLYTAKKEKALIDIKSQTVDLQKETFLFNTALSIKKQNAEISKLEELIKADSAIINLRNRIKKTALAQLEYGVINTSDYLREVNAEDQANQTQLLHELQLLKAVYDQKTTTGN